MPDIDIHKYAQKIESVKNLVEKDWEWITKEDIKMILSEIDADPQISGYHITQEFSSFVTPEQLEYKRKSMTPRMFTNEVLGK